MLAEWTYGTSTTNNQKGRLVKSRINGNDTDAVVEYDSYDPDGRLLSQDVIIAGTSYDIDFAYHDGGAVDTITYPLVPGGSVREVVDHVYDGLGNPFSLDGDHTYVDSALWTYTGAPDVWVLGDGADITRSWSYDRSTLRLGTIRAGTSQLTGTWNLLDLSYTHTDAGNVSSITDTLNTSQVECFDYDLHNRLIDAFTGDDCTGYDAGVGSGPYDQDFAYSAIHNITSFDGASYTYGTGNASGAGDAGPHAVTSISAGAVTFGYDDNGNRITRTENSQTTS